MVQVHPGPPFLSKFLNSIVPSRHRHSPIALCHNPKVTQEVSSPNELISVRIQLVQTITIVWMVVEAGTSLLERCRHAVQRFSLSVATVLSSYSLRRSILEIQHTLFPTARGTYCIANRRFLALSSWRIRHRYLADFAPRIQPTKSQRPGHDYIDGRNHNHAVSCPGKTAIVGSHQQLHNASRRRTVLSMRVPCVDIAGRTPGECNLAGCVG